MSDPCRCLESRSRAAETSYGHPPCTGPPRAITRTSATSCPATESPRSRSTGRRSATPSVRRRSSRSPTRSTQAREDNGVGVIILTGEGPLAFCSGGDQRVRGDTGYVAGGAGASGASTSPTCTSRCGACRSRSSPWSRATRSAAATSCTSSATSRSPPTTRASGRPGRGSARFDGGYGAALLSRIVGPKKAKEIWFLCRQYDAQQALDMGLVNTVVPLERARGRDGEVVPRDARALPVRPAPR